MEDRSSLLDSEVVGTQEDFKSGDIGGDATLGMDDSMKQIDSEGLKGSEEPLAKQPRSEGQADVSDKCVKQSTDLPEEQQRIDIEDVGQGSKSILDESKLTSGKPLNDGAELDKDLEDKDIVEDGEELEEEEDDDKSMEKSELGVGSKKRPLEVD
jgi:hypothetical protein